MATTYSMTRTGVVNNSNIKDLLQAHVILVHDILRKTEQYEIVREQNNEFFIDILSTDLMRLSADLVRIADAVRDKVESTIAA